MVRALDKADAMLTLSSAVWYREPFTINKRTLPDTRCCRQAVTGNVTGGTRDCSRKHCQPCGIYDTIRYDTIVEFKVESKAEYSIQLNLAHVARN